MSLIAGDILLKRYRIVHRLGEGKAGSVYRAYDTRAEQNVAIKEYLDPDVETQQLFRAEARKLSNLKHPQLPAVLDHFAVKNVGQYLVTEYIDGVDLATVVAQDHPLPSARVIGWLQEAAKPLAYMHQNGQLHLDVKPANIRVTPKGDVFLVDTGLPGLGIPAGNKGFAAPEQQAQRNISPTTDIYGLGATLFNLLTNQIPIDAIKREMELEPFIPAREIHADVEPYLSLVATRALSLQRGARYDDVAAFVKALDRPSGSPPIAAREQFMPEQRAVPRRVAFGRKQRRQMETRTIMALSLILLSLMAAGLYFGIFRTGGDGVSAEPTSLAATVESQVAVALTQVAPTATPIPPATEIPTPTPEAFVHRASAARMIFVPEGSFNMGTDDGDDDSGPQHRVKLPAFFIDETETTNRQYASCVDAGACNPPQRLSATFHPSYYGDPKYHTYPVIFVDWGQADTYCRWRDGRLPSEAEWEYAAGYRASVSAEMKYPWGDVFSDPVANFCDTNCTTETRNTQYDDGHRDTAPVKSYPDGRSSYDIYDMAGNVMEWVGDWYDADYYTSSADDGPLGPTTGDARVIRGGSWLSEIDDLEVTSRGSFLPQVARANLGFRCAMSPEQVTLSDAGEE